MPDRSMRFTQRAQTAIFKLVRLLPFVVGFPLLFPIPFWAQIPLEGTRRPQYAGSWYDANPERLRAQLKEFLEKATPLVDERSISKLSEQNAHLSTPLLAIVVPHAGYAFSGQAAAHAYEAARQQKVKRVYLLGPSHHVGFHGAALPMDVTFATPLGDLQVDRPTVNELVAYPLFSMMPEVHKVEHSLELQLPFIRQAFGEVEIVPIVIGMLSDASEVRLIAEILKGFIGPGDLVVVSSDFTHYGPRYDYTPYPGSIKDNVLKLDRQSYSHLSQLDLEGFMKFQQETRDTICGFFPCAVLCALLPEGTRVSALKYYTSQDCALEDRNNSVSYMALAFSGKSWPEHPKSVPAARDVVNLNEKEKSALLALSRRTIEFYLDEGRRITPEEAGITITPAMKRCFGAFVTLYKKAPNAGGTIQSGAGDGKELRGCIGNMWPVSPLWEAVQENSIAAATRDYRFPPLERGEISDITLEINVLTPPRRIKSRDQIVLGRDGIIFNKDGHSSVFLPLVPLEFKWTLEETLRQLAIKAQLRPSDFEGAKLDIFQSEIISELPVKR